MFIYQCLTDILEKDPYFDFSISIQDFLTDKSDDYKKKISEIIFSINKFDNLKINVTNSILCVFCSFLNYNKIDTILNNYKNKNEEDLYIVCLQITNLNVLKKIVCKFPNIIDMDIKKIDTQNDNLLSSVYFLDKYYSDIKNLLVYSVRNRKHDIFNYLLKTYKDYENGIILCGYQFSEMKSKNQLQQYKITGYNIDNNLRYLETKKKYKNNLYRFISEKLIYTKFIRELVYKSNNINLINIFLENTISYSKLYDTKNIIEKKNYNVLNKLDWKNFLEYSISLFSGKLIYNHCGVCEPLPEIRKENFKSKNVIISMNIFIFKYAIKYLSDTDVKSIIHNYSNLNINHIIGTKGVKPYLKLLYNYIDDSLWKTENMGYYPILNCAKYSDFETFKFLLNKTDLINTNIYTNSQYEQNIIYYSILNKDYRILDYLLDYLKNKQHILYTTLNDNTYSNEIYHQIILGLKDTYGYYKSTKFCKKLIYIKIDTIFKHVNDSIKNNILSEIFTYVSLNNTGLDICSYLLNKYTFKINTRDWRSNITYYQQENRHLTYLKIPIIKKLIDSLDRHDNEHTINFVINNTFITAINDPSFENNIIDIIDEVINYYNKYYNINLFDKTKFDNIDSNIQCLMTFIYFFIYTLFDKYKYNLDNIYSLCDKLLKKYKSIFKVDDILYYNFYGMVNFNFRFNNSKIIDKILNLFFNNGIYPDMIKYCDEHVFNKNKYYKNISNKYKLLYFVNVYKKYKNIQTNKLSNSNINLNSCYCRNTIRDLNYCNTSLLKWIIVILSLKTYFDKKRKNNFTSYKKKLKKINSEIKYSPSNYIDFNHKDRDIPIHIEPKHLYDPNINYTHTFITQKADGIYGNTIINVYPDINKIDLDYEYEYLKKINIYFIFGCKDKTIDNFSYINKLRSQHPYVPKLDFSLTKENLKTYIKLESEALNKYIKKFAGKRLWWPKFIFNIKGNYEEYITILNEITTNPIACIPNDGWILFSKNSELKTYKIKPYSKLTIDLVYNKNKNSLESLEGKFNVHNLKNINLRNGVIYRCYYDSSLNIWIPKEIRTDKKTPNNDKICFYINKCQTNKWFISDIKTTKNNYYQKQTLFNTSVSNKKFFVNYNNIIEYLKNNCCENKSILDIGCGFTNKFNKFKNKNTYIGFDVNKQLASKDKQNLFLVDMKTKWNYDDQEKIFGKTYNYFRNIEDYNKLRTKKYDVILCINSIHNSFNTLLDWDNFNENLISVRKKNTNLIIRFLDKDLLEKIFNIKKHVMYNGSYIRQISNFNDTNSNNKALTDYKIKIYYDWCHNNPIDEYVIDSKLLINLLKEKGWNIQHTYSEDIDINNNSDEHLWENYFKCFKTMIFSC